MGLLNKMLAMRDAQLKTLPESAGPAVVITGDAGDHSETREVWGQPGVWSMPPDGTFGILSPVDGSCRFGVIMATHHYETPRPTLTKGETAMGSTSADGKTLKAKTIYKSDGSQELNGNSKFFVTHAELNTALQGLITKLNTDLGLIQGGATAAVAAAGLWLTPLVIGGATLDITAAKTTTIKTGG